MQYFLIEIQIHVFRVSFRFNASPEVISKQNDIRNAFHEASLPHRFAFHSHSGHPVPVHVVRNGIWSEAAKLQKR